MGPTAQALTPDEAEERIVAMLAADGLPRFAYSKHDRTANVLELTWEHGLTFCFELDGGHIEPFDERDREVILGTGTGCDCPPIDITVPGSSADPRDHRPIPGVRIHHVPELHPDDTWEIDGLPCTSPSRTLIDLAEVMDADELRETFGRARDRGLLDRDALLASRARVEWRPSLAMLDEVIEEFCG